MLNISSPAKEDRRNSRMALTASVVFRLSKESVEEAKEEAFSHRQSPKATIYTSKELDEKL